MSDLAAWLSMLLWPCGVLLVVLAVHLEARISERRARHAGEAHSATSKPAE